jgi:RNA polymerase sigma-70 factor (ECF subfamily)
LGDEDVRLMLAFRNGDEGAFEALFRRWGGRLLRFLERMVRDRAVAEELVQETFLRVHRSRERYAPEARFSTWLYTIAANAARNELRRPFRRSIHASTDADDGPELAADGPAVDDRVHAQRMQGRVEAALEALPERQRAALWLCAVEGLSYAQVAEALETTEKSVKALVHRARVALASSDAVSGEAPEAARTGKVEA